MKKTFREAVIIEKRISTMSVILCTGATFGLKENLLPSYSTLENSFIWICRCGSIYFPYFKAIYFQRYWTLSQSYYITLMLLLSPSKIWWWYLGIIVSFQSDVVENLEYWAPSYCLVWSLNSVVAKQWN